MTTETNLPERAREVDSFLQAHFLDSNGVVLSHLDKETLRVPEESFFPVPVKDMQAGEDWFVSGFTRSAVAGYENCGMCTGAYLESLLFRYQVEKDPAVLALAGRCFEALSSIYDQGCQLEEGFFPKIYGNRFTTQTSTDQVLYAVFAMDHYWDLAPPAHREAIATMIPEMVRFWMKRKYNYSYYHLEAMDWPIMRFPPFLLLAHKYSGEPGFLQEYHRLLGEGVKQLPEWAQRSDKSQGRRSLSEFEREHNVFVISNMADCLTMDVMNLDLLLRLDPTHTRANQWREGISSMWDEAKITLAPNGKYYSQVLVDQDTGAVRRPEGFDQGAPAGTESGWSTLVARGAVMASVYLPERRPEIREKVGHVLKQIGIPEMTYLDNPERLPPRQRFKTQCLSGDAITNWLWAYWQGRHLGLFA